MKPGVRLLICGAELSRFLDSVWGRLQMEAGIDHSWLLLLNEASAGACRSQ